MWQSTWVIFFYIFQFKLLSNTKQSSIPVLCGSLQSPSNSYPTGKGAQGRVVASLFHSAHCHTFSTGHELCVTVHLWESVSPSTTKALTGSVARAPHTVPSQRSVLLAFNRSRLTSSFSLPFFGFWCFWARVSLGEALCTDLTGLRHRLCECGDGSTRPNAAVSFSFLRQCLAT